MKHPVSKYLLCSLVLLAAVMPAAAQAPQSAGYSARASTDSAAIRIGEQFRLTLEVKAEKNTPLLWTQVPDSFDHFLVVGRGKVDTLVQPDTEVYRQQITLTSFDSGYWKIPSFTFKVRSGDSTLTLPGLVTDSFLVQVNTVPVDTTKPFRPIKQIRSVPFNILAYWPYMLGGVIVLLLLLYFIFFRKKKVKLIPRKVIPQEPPYDQALKALKSLEQEKLWQHGEIKTYYTRLTDILRLYIERTFGIMAMEQTSDELLEKVKSATKLNQQRDNLRYILQTADLAKFARSQPSREEHEASMRKAYEVLEWTKPKPEAGVPGEDENKN